MCWLNKSKKKQNKNYAGGGFYLQVKANSSTQVKAGLKDTAEIKNTDAEQEDASADIKVKGFRPHC